MKTGAWQNVVHILMLIRQIREPLDRVDLLEKIKALFPNWKCLRVAVLQGQAAGLMDSTAKACDAEVRKQICYIPRDQAKNCGRDGGRISKPFVDRTMQDVLQLAYWLVICKAYQLDPRRLFSVVNSQLATTAGFCRSVVKICKACFPNRKFSKLENNILPVQAGLLLNQLLFWPWLEELEKWNWSAECMLLRNGLFEDRFYELLVRTNQPIFDSGLGEVIEPVTMGNLQTWLELAKEYAWPYFLSTELIPSESVPDELAFPLCGVFDEFRDDSDRNQFYWDR